MNNFPVRKAIQTCSYNDSGDDLEKKIIEQPDRERAAGKDFVNHLILRNSGSAKDHLKFNITIAGIPLFLYGLFGMHKAGFEEVVTVGNDDTGKIHRLFCDYFDIKGYEFVHEGQPQEWSMSNSIRKGQEKLNPGLNDVVLISPGDTPLLDMLALASSEAVKEHDMVIPFNTKELCGDLFPRNYHVKAINEDGTEYLSKEPNALLLNIRKLEENRFGENIYDMAFSARKSYAAGSPQKKFFLEAVFKDNGGFSARRALRSLGIIKPGYFLSQASKLIARNTLGLKENDNNVLKLKIEIVEELLQHALNIPDFKVKAYASPDPAGLLDVDSFQDVVFVEKMLSLGQKSVYPHFDELKGFAGSVKSWGCDFTDNWKSFANECFHKYGIKAYYGNCTGFSQSTFPESVIEGEVELIKRYRQSLK